MSQLGPFGDVSVEIGDDHVAVVEIHRPPHNFFSPTLIASLADAYEAIDADGSGRAILLCSEGRNFCAGADFGGGDRTLGGETTARGGRHLYDEAVRLFEAQTPVVAAVQGAAIGGGLGLAMSADFRVGTPESRFAANFARLGFHHGFGLTVTLPLVVGHQYAIELLYSGRRTSGDEAAASGLIDRCVEAHQLRPAARELAAEIAASAPLAVRSIRATMRGHLPDAIRAATDREKAEQDRLAQTEDWAEGVSATAERRTPHFQGR
jgi:2-(1,2-epoxy-1,2-dihydrophenyl)acetyl-CoA isomerase